jgi:FkbM family methyltransferase
MKCAVIMPVEPGDALYALDAEDSVKHAHAAGLGMFSEVECIKLVYHPDDAGTSIARNAGVKLAQQAGAEWIYFLDARDVLDRNAFTHVAASLRNHDAVWGAICELDARETSGVLRAGQLFAITGIAEVLSNDPDTTLQIGHFVKTAVASATPFDPSLGAGAEFDYFLRLWSKFRCVKIPQPFFYERRVNVDDASSAALEKERRTTARRLIRDKCAELDFRAQFTHRGENFQFCVANPFDLIHHNLLKGRFFELPELSFVENWVGSGAAIVEVGAYVGNHVVYYSRFMHPRSILVLEPNPQAIGLLRRNLEVNAVTVADVSRLGIGAAAKTGNYDLVCEGDDNHGATRLVPAAGGALKSAPLDDLIGGNVDFIKVDVEGMELEVLAGAERVIAASRPKIMIEVFRAQVQRFDSWLLEHRYRICTQFDYVHAINYLIEPGDA